MRLVAGALRGALGGLAVLVVVILTAVSISLFSAVDIRLPGLVAGRFAENDGLPDVSFAVNDLGLLLVVVGGVSVSVLLTVRKEIREGRLGMRVRRR
ncbi:hypothetical protein EDF46_2183 [Frondihabitans sp. PhB188]|uniref:hypothetical protein n=1 Tax=Frondihabitans sp. PhB188 TaxID=2485200 RepID=UPI000F47897D|nr:hypothetical protein [Frondihabitans sp. PhB188]ROQ38544.1 hypothetical protein EDF46_2183 [Frondihabitans sp. PhB188]